MKVFFVAAHHKVFHGLERVIRHHFDFQTHRTRKTQWGPGCFFNQSLGCHFDGLAIQCIFQFGFVQLMITAQQHRHRFFINHINKGFHQLFGSDLQKSGHLVNGSLTRCIHPGQGLKSIRIHRGHVIFVLHLRPFQVGRIIACGAIDDPVLAGFGQYHEFVGITSPNGAGIRFNGPEFQTASLKYSIVSLVHGLVTAVGPRLIHVKAVGVFHDEFAAAHNPETGADLIPELGLDLVEINGHLFVGMNLFSHQVRNHLFVGGPHAGLPVMTVLEPQQFTAIIFPPATLLPQLGRLNRGHENFDGACPVHLLPHNILHLPDGLKTDGKVCINA